jgi:ribonucleoside-diphosphate reductase alpha chain
MTLPTDYQSIIHQSRYARYLPESKRRETWEETVNRYINYLKDKAHLCSENEHTEELSWLLDNKIKSAILNLEVMPSMRLMMVAGEACERDNISAYNCSYLAINNKRAFSEALYVLMNGTGVGFSCERQEISKLPLVPEILKESEDVIVVGDSKLGWAKAFKKLLSSLWEGDIPKVDYSHIRPAGARLKTFGGRASGPEPLRRLFEFVTSIFNDAVGRKLTSIEVHDIICMIGEIVVVGGVRRSALISLSNLTDRRMREAKTGAWWNETPWRSLANNSATYTEKPDMESFMEEWLALVKSKSGERGIFNRVAAQKQASKWGRRDPTIAYGVNPCGEVLLRDKEFCNLSSVIVRSTDTFEDLKYKIKLATILGTIQSTLTNFNFLSEEWKKNTEEERLLGVSLTGIMDHPLLNGSGETEDIYKQFVDDNGNIIKLSTILEELRDYARSVNEEWASKLGIPVSVAITLIKPEGTVSQLVDSSSGIHPRHSSYYLRRIRLDKKDSLYEFFKTQGIHTEDEFLHPNSTTVLTFPIKSPSGAICRKDISALDHLNLWLIYKQHWCEHNPSITITVKPEEWLEVGAWVYKHFDNVLGLSFLPYSEHTYIQAPNEDITEEQYNELISKNTTSINWNEFIEEEDNTTSSQELACVAGQCEISQL